jgi:hypothetical protein
LLTASLTSSQLAAAQQGLPTSSSSSMRLHRGELMQAMRMQGRHRHGVAGELVVLLLAALARAAMSEGECDIMCGCGVLRC